MLANREGEYMGVAPKSDYALIRTEDINIVFWKLVLNPLGGVFGIYELLPAFLFSCLCIVVGSLLTKAPSKEVEEDFEAVKSGNV